jgi:hypothetical protein
MAEIVKRSLHGPEKKPRLKITVDRRRRFESNAVPANKQFDSRLKEDMAVLHLTGISKRTFATVSKRILGAEVGKDTRKVPSDDGA